MLVEANLSCMARRQACSASCSANAVFGSEEVGMCWRSRLSSFDIRMLIQCSAQLRMALGLCQHATPVGVMQVVFPGYCMPAMPSLQSSAPHFELQSLKAVGAGNATAGVGFCSSLSITMILACDI